MHKTDFDTLRDQLLRSGIAPRHVVRAVAELCDHFDDLESDGETHGLAPEAASRQASERIGALETIALAYRSTPELKCWIFRYPRTARVILPVACVLLLPAVPIYAGLSNASVIGRWCLCLLLSAFITAMMLLVMQISIAFS